MIFVHYFFSANVQCDRARLPVGRDAGARVVNIKQKPRYDSGIFLALLISKDKIRGFCFRHKRMFFPRRKKYCHPSLMKVKTTLLFF